MSITDLFIRRPVTALVMIGIVLFGIAGYRALPVSDLPNVDFPTIQVNASLPGASPETMATAVATPLERQFATVAGIDTITSNSGVGSTGITIQFTLDRSIDGAAADVQSAIAAVLRLLPPGMPSPPTMRKVNPGEMPVILLGLSGPTMQLSKLDEYAENLMAQRILVAGWRGSSERVRRPEMGGPCAARSQPAWLRATSVSMKYPAPSIAQCESAHRRCGAPIKRLRCARMAAHDWLHSVK
jgi:hypothetical protein